MSDNHSVINNYIKKLNKEFHTGRATEPLVGRVVEWARHLDTNRKAIHSMTAWEFYIGGYQPAQKWLKDRKGRTLNYEDIAHYQKIIVALSETARIMGAVDGVGVC